MKYTLLIAFLAFTLRITAQGAALNDTATIDIDSVYNEVMPTIKSKLITGWVLAGDYSTFIKNNKGAGYSGLFGLVVRKKHAIYLQGGKILPTTSIIRRYHELATELTYGGAGYSYTQPIGKWAHLTAGCALNYASYYLPMTAKLKEKNPKYAYCNPYVFCQSILPNYSLGFALKLSKSISITINYRQFIGYGNLRCTSHFNYDHITFGKTIITPSFISFGLTILSK